MSGLMVLVLYACSAVLALLLLSFFRARAWYWHAISVLLALVIGLTPPPERLQGPKNDLAIGCVFVFLFLWGVGGVVFRKRRSASHA